MSSSPPPAPPEPPAHDDPVLSALWGKVIGAWGEEDRHRVVLEYARASEKLPELAGLYAALKSDAERGEVAKKKLDAITLIVTTELLSNRENEAFSRRARIWIWLFALVVSATLIGVAVYHWGRR